MKTLLHLAIGGVVTSVAEYIFGYNLFDLLLDQVKKLLGLARA